MREDDTITVHPMSDPAALLARYGISSTELFSGSPSGCPICGTCAMSAIGGRVAA